METNQQHNEWMLSLAQQLGSMKVLATNIMGASASVGVALGGAAGTVAGAAIAGVQGMVQGVPQVRTGQPALPDIPDLEAPEDYVSLPPEPFVKKNRSKFLPLCLGHLVQGVTATNERDGEEKGLRGHKIARTYPLRFEEAKIFTTTSRKN